MQHRATPFGLFAGPAPLRLGTQAHVRWGTEHRAYAGADAAWLTETITALERDPAVLQALTVVADRTWIPKGPRIVVPYQPGWDGPTCTSLRRTRAAERVLSLARTPIRVRDLIDRVRKSYADTPAWQIETMVADLVGHGVLLTNLRAPMTSVDLLGYLVDQLDHGGVDVPTTAQLRKIWDLLQLHDDARSDDQADLRAQAVEAICGLAPATNRHLVVNVRPDVEVVLPQLVAREAERALEVMARITPYPNGSPAWNDYRARFLERYSLGTVVPVRDLTDPDTGLGVPVGYLGTVLPRPVLGTRPRDDYLLALAQDAALTGRREVVLTETDLDALSSGTPTQVPAHVELCFSVLATSHHALDQGRFTLSTVGLSLAAGTTTGRFVPLLPPGARDRWTAACQALPTLTAGAVRAQLSAPPLKQQTFNVARSPVMAPEVLAVGEHNPAATFDVDDLGVVAYADRLYLVSLSRGQVIEPSVMNAVELSHATHPLVRFLCEVHRSHAAILVPFAWGTAARLPFLPRVRYGRTILSAACWRLHAKDVGDAADWKAQFTQWRIRYDVPRTVYVGSSDQLLRLDLDLPAHQDLLRHEVDRHRTVVLHEAPEDSAFGWIGHAHEVVLPLVADQQPSPGPGRTAVARRDAGRLPGASEHAYVKLYGNAARAPELLTTHLPRLLEDWDGDPAMWFVRYADPEHHVRLRLRLPSPQAFGVAAQKVATWASRLREDGLIQRIAWDTDQPETGRYGTGHVLQAAQTYFAADSAAAQAQLLLDSADDQTAVAAASFVDIAIALLGSRRAGLDWLICSLARSEGQAPPRHVQALAGHLTGPDMAQGALAGPAVAQAWERRHGALHRYREALQSCGRDPVDVLPSLLHMHHNRVAGIDPAAEATCRRIARAAALSWTARTEGALR